MFSCSLEVLLPPDAGGAAAALGGPAHLQRRHLAAQVYEEGHGRRGFMQCSEFGFSGLLDLDPDSES